MIRRVIHIDEDKCNGCGACVTACHEGAIGLVDGKARLMRDDYCDGLGAVSYTHLVGISALSEAQMNAELEKGYADMQSGHTRSAKSVFTDIRKDYNI